MVEVMAFDTELRSLFCARRPHLLAIGEPYHGEPAFPHLRNRILETLVGYGFRSIAIESDRAAGLAVNDYVQGRRDDVDVTTGISHGWGTHPATHELIDWLRAHNEKLPPHERVTFHGFDAPTEITGAPSPLPILCELREYLSAPVDLDWLVGEDSRWTAPEIMFDAARSPGRSQEANALRGVAEDFRTQLYVDAPHLIRGSSVESWDRARVLATTAIGLLTYHATMAEPNTQSQRIGRLLAVRDALMAQNLIDIHAHERDRGPILVCAHNAHLQRHPSRWASHWDGQDLAAQWNGAGSIVSELLGERYVYVAGSLGASGPVGLGPPEPGTYEERLGPETGIFPPPTGDDLRERVADLLGLFSLDPGTIETCDAILHIGFEPGAADAARIAGLPGVTETRIPTGSELPPHTWGDRFFFTGEDRVRPFATIVGHDVPGFDERSRLSRPGRYRLNIEVGRTEFRNLFGYGPEQFAVHSSGLDFAETDRLLPHPTYGVQGWASVVNPGPATADEVTRLVAQARSRSAARAYRRKRRP